MSLLVMLNPVQIIKEKIKNSPNIKTIFISLGIILLFFSSVTALCNYIINPYGVFLHEQKLCQSYDKSCDRQTLYPTLKLRQDQNWDIVLAGASTLYTSVSEEKLAENFPNKNICKLTLNMATTSEHYDMIKNFIKLNPEVKKVVACIDFGEIANHEPNKLPKFYGKNLNKDELYFLLLSPTTCKFTFLSVYWAIKDCFINFISSLKNPVYSQLVVMKDDEILKIKEKHRFPRLKFIDWNDWKINENSFSDFKKMKEFCDDNNIEIIFYTNPIHANCIYDIYYHGLYDQIEYFKTELSKITPFYDFIYVSEYSNKPISMKNPYWMDGMHADVNLGDVIMKRILASEGDFGVYITKENLNNVLQKQKNALSNHIKHNKKVLDEFVNYKLLDDTPAEDSYADEE